MVQTRSTAKTQMGRPVVKNLCATHAVAAANSPLCQAKSVRRIDIEVETTALHGFAIHLLINFDSGFRRQTPRIIEVSIDRLRP